LCCRKSIANNEMSGNDIIYPFTGIPFTGIACLL
jgi:hypothetical protein